MDKVLFIDGNNAIYRADIKFGPPIKHGLCSVSTCNNPKHSKIDLHCNCGAAWDSNDNFCFGDHYLIIFNFFRNLRPIIEQFSPDKCFFVLEGRPQFRYNLFPDYKANRIIKKASFENKKERFNVQRDMILSLIKFLPLTICRASNYEADDVIGTLSSNMQEEDITIISNDSDYIQLLQRNYSNIKIFNPIKKTFMKAPTYPYVGWKSLNGDKSDNIPGILKPKMALKYIQDPTLFKSFLEIEENRANFNINRELIEFKEVPLNEINIEDGVKDFNSLKSEFIKMKFESLIKDDYWEKYCNTFNCLSI